MLDLAKQKILIELEKFGWYRHPKETQEFMGLPITATRGAFFRQHEKDDAWLYLLSRHYKNILDIGCNIGQSSMLMLIGTDNRMVCVDPNPLALSRCAENLIVNNMATKVSFVNAFVGEEEGKIIEFFTVGTGAAGSMFPGFAKSAARYKQSYPVRTRTISSICLELNFMPALIKIDVEGAERFVIRGVDDAVLEHRPSLFVEMHSGKELSITDNTNSLLEWCAEKNYMAYYLKTHQPLVVSDIVNRGRYHALLLPEGDVYPDYLKSIPENSRLSFVISK